MKCSLITIEIIPVRPLKKRYTGSIFRGWLGTVLKCEPSRVCSDACEDRQNCPYYMVFREKTDVKPYALLSFPDRDRVINFIKVYGDRRRFVPRILSMINDDSSCTHFDGTHYAVENIEARTLVLPAMQLGKTTEIVFVSPTHLMSRGCLEILPSLPTLLRACMRAYNRVTKLYDTANYPYHCDPALLASPAEILDYNVRKVNVVHENMYDQRIALEGIIGSITYDTASIPPEAGTILKMGEMLQVGKHSTYGFGGMVVKQGTCTP